MRVILLILVLFIVGCKPQEIVMCCDLVSTGSSSIKWVSNEDSDSQKYRLTGTVFNYENGDFEPFVKIKIVDQLNNLITGGYSDIDGEFAIDINPGHYFLEIHHPGYEIIKVEFDALEEMVEGVEVTFGN